MSTARPLHPATALDGISQEACDAMRARIVSLSGEIVAAADRMHAQDPNAPRYAAPLTFTKIFLMLDALSGGDANGKRLLDVGCGGGGLMAQAFALGMHPLGIDIYGGQAHSREVAEALLAAAAMDAATIAESVRDADITALPDDLIGQFDFVVSLGMLEHIPQPEERSRAVQNMIRALKPGGSMILECAPNSRVPFDLFHFGPRFPLYHMLPDRLKRIYMASAISRRHADLNEVQRDPRFLTGVPVAEIETAIRAVDRDATIVRAFPLVTRLSVSRGWLRRPSAQRVVGAISNLLVRLKMEPLIVVVAVRPALSAS